MKLTNNSLNTILNYCNIALTGIFSYNERKATLQILLPHFLGITKNELLFNKEKLFPKKQIDLIVEAIEELKKGKPLAYILGEWEFYGLKFKVDEHTLIPRPETEELVQLIINQNTGKLRIIDIGTGSGCIALALKNNLPQSTVYAWDISNKALEKVKKNANLNSLQIEINQADILNQPYIDRKVDIIVSNPPYIPENEKNIMAKNVLNYEPHLALFINDDEPLLFYNAIADFASMNLVKKGRLYFEINENYGNAVRKMLMDKAFKNVNIVKDINNKDRIVYCNNEVV